MDIIYNTRMPGGHLGDVAGAGVLVPPEGVTEAGLGLGVLAHGGTGQGGPTLPATRHRAVPAAYM